MGGGSWVDEDYKSREEVREKTKATAFVYNEEVKKKPVEEQKAHRSMDPKGVNRESRDSAAHPESVAIGVMLDETGSMLSVPRIVQKKLGQLMAMILRKGYLAHPQILFGAIGDANSDRASLQVGQFESDINMEDDLGRIFLEGNGGGGNSCESYQNALYFFARHTSIDCFEKRNKKGYLFLIGDEHPYGAVNKLEVERLIGDTLEANISTEDIVAELTKKYIVFYILPQDTSHAREPEIKEHWGRLLGPENVLSLTDANSVCECIAGAIGLCEGVADIDNVASHLKEAGATTGTVASVVSGLGELAKKTSLARVGTGNLPERAKPTETTTRL